MSEVCAHLIGGTHHGTRIMVEGRQPIEMLKRSSTMSVVAHHEHNEIIFAEKEMYVCFAHTRSGDYVFEYIENSYD